MNAPASDQTAEARRIADSQPPHSTLAGALVAALAELTVVEAARSAEIPIKGGGSYSYKYADIADVVKLTRPVLAKHGIVALTPVHDHGSGLAVTVTLLHASSGRLDLGPFPFEPGRDAQSTGSAVTYHRRYALIAALGMAAGDDDDGAAAKPREPEFVWTTKAVQFKLRELLDGDRERAALVWSEAKGDDVPPSAEAAAQILADWSEHQPAVEPVVS